MKNSIKLVGIASLLALGACQSNQTPPDLSRAQLVSYEYKRDNVVSQVSTIPSWFVEIPNDDASIYSAGTSTTPDMQFSIDAAVLNAKVILADRINSRLRAQIKQFRAKVGSGDFDVSMTSELESAVKNITANTDVSGYHIAKMSVVPAGVQYRAFVLLEYSDLEARKILTNRMRKDQILMDRIRATRAWKELDKNAKEKSLDDAARLNAIINSSKES
jgi:hypothetical protein|tara:strand:+ start:1867 stop:2520 length:654 start_codon:yes stop_codon:yes gene_type:complete